MCNETASHCAACDRALKDDEYSIKGIYSGQDLGLCRYCANIANSAAASGFGPYNLREDYDKL